MPAESSDGDIVVRRGTYLYDNQVECDVRIVYSHIRYGSGDPVDPPESDEPRDSYYVQYGDVMNRGAFVGGAGCFDTLDDAVRHAERLMQGLRWLV